MPLSLFPGVDFGTLNTVIAVARNRGVDVVRSSPARLAHTLMSITPDFPGACTMVYAY